MRNVLVEWLDQRIEMSAGTFGFICLALGFLFGLSVGLLAH